MTSHTAREAARERARARAGRKQVALLNAVREGGGVVRTRMLVGAGYSTHHQSLAVAAGKLKRVGRSWLALPGADAALIQAAEAGVVVTCCTQARRLGLWQLNDDGQMHAAVPSHGHGPRGGSYRLHWAEPAVPRHPDMLVDSIENVLALVAECVPHDEALAVWESALNRGVIEFDTLHGLWLRPAARALRDEAVPWSDSGLESFVPPRLRFLRLPIVPQVWIAGHHVDFLIGDRLVLQIDGGTHGGGSATPTMRTTRNCG